MRPRNRSPEARNHNQVRYGVRLSYALVDAAMPPITRAGLFHASKIWIDDAHGGAARCRRVALRQRRVAAFVIVGPPRLVNMQANRISRIVRLGPNGYRRQNRRNRQNRQSRNPHQSLLRDIRAESPTKRDAIPHQSAPDAGWQSSHRWGWEDATLALLKCRRNEREKCRLIVRVAVPPARPRRPVFPQRPTRGRAPLAGWLALNVSTYSFGRRDVRNVHQHFIRPVHVEHLAAGHFMKRLHGLPGWAAPGACQRPTAHISVRSNLSRRAMPENRIVSQFEVTQYDTIGYRSA